MRNFEEDLDDWQEASRAAGTLTVTQVQVAEGGQQPVAGLQAADATHPAPVQEAADIYETTDVTGGRPRSLAGLSTEASPVKLHQADTIQPASVQVNVCSVELDDAASNSPVGNVASGRRHSHQTRSPGCTSR